jgi:methionyl-tRNA formyltransferase
VDGEAVLKSYIIASSRDWHRRKFDEFVVTRIGEKWVYVSDREALADALQEDTPRYVFFLHWSWIVPLEVTEKHECVCFHMTDLPYGRGGSPLQNLILRGKQETRVTSLRMTEGVDCGPIYGKRPMSLDGTALEIYLRAGDLSWSMIQWIVEENPVPTPQCGEVTLFRRRTPSESEIPEDVTINQLYDFVRMLDAPGYPKAFLKHGSLLLEFAEANLQGGELTIRATVKTLASEVGL